MPGPWIHEAVLHFLKANILKLILDILFITICYREGDENKDDNKSSLGRKLLIQIFRI